MCCAPPLPPSPLRVVRSTVRLTSIPKNTKPRKAQPFVGPLQHQGHASSNTRPNNYKHTRGITQNQGRPLVSNGSSKTSTSSSSGDYVSALNSKI